MTTEPIQSGNAVEANVSAAFIAQSREFLSNDYLPKIERCLEGLSDQDLWWRANQESNSIGNLLLHLSGNARQWIVCGLGGATDQRVRQTEFDERSLISREELLVRLRETLGEVEAVLAQFDEAQLLNRLSHSARRRDRAGSDLSCRRALFDAHRVR